MNNHNWEQRLMNNPIINAGQIVVSLEEYNRYKEENRLLRAFVKRVVGQAPSIFSTHNVVLFELGIQAAALLASLSQPESEGE